MSHTSGTRNTCTICGAPSTGRTQFASGFSESFACGSKNHSDGFEQGFACIEAEEKAKAAPGVTESVTAPPGLLGDMTALALSAGIRGMTIEAVCQRVTEICKQHGLQPKNTDREKVIQHCNDLSLAIALTRRPDIKDDALDALLDAMRDDIRNRITLLAVETKENA